MEILQKTKTFQIKSLGKQKKTVYDIEVKDLHNFFGNDILVHNSVYITLDKLVQHVFKGEKPPVEKLIHFMDKCL